MPMLNLIIFLFGLAVGSFLNSIVFRYNTGERVTKGRSRCFNCGKELSWAVLIPLYDVKHKIIPDSFSYSFLALAFLSKFIFFEINLLDLFLSLLPALFLFCLWFFSRGRWMGLGDAKLMIGGGIFLGFPGSIYAALLGFWIGAIFGILLLLGSSGITIKSEIPFGPFLVIPEEP